MSFILDALRKSETDRQQKGSAEFAGVPTSSGRREGPPVWLWVVAVLLLVNLAVLVGVFLRPDGAPPTQTAVQAVEAPAATEPADDDRFAERVEVARRNAPPREEAPLTPAKQPAARAPATATTNALALPTIHELRANGTVNLPDLHVDIHVYSESPEDRFVFINMVKHNEGSRLPEGPLVSEITPDGVVLNQAGTVFLLPRD